MLGTWCSDAGGRPSAVDRAKHGRTGRRSSNSTEGAASTAVGCYDVFFEEASACFSVMLELRQDSKHIKTHIGTSQKGDPSPMIFAGGAA